MKRQSPPDTSSDSESDYYESPEDDEVKYYSENETDNIKTSKMMLIIDPKMISKSLNKSFREAKQDKSQVNVINVNKKQKTEKDIQREKIIGEITDINSVLENNLTDRVIFSNLPIQKKAIIIAELDKYTGSDKSKYSSYIDKVLAVPTGIVKEIQHKLSDAAVYLLKLRQNMDSSIYGHYDTKEEIIDYVSGIFTNPNAKGNVLALQSSPGMGKTKFVRALGKSLGLPFNQISLGGISDPGILVGHDYTYIGSKPGRIYDALCKSKCMNPIIYLDECDKIPQDKSVELNGILTHLLDKEQNMDFKDNYLGDISLDLSKVLFILSFNDETAIDPVVFNRLKVIKINENTRDEKVQIVKQFTIKEICENLGISLDKFIITDDVIRHVIDNTESEPGMRKITRNFETIFNKINTKILISNSEHNAKITQGFRGNSTQLKYNYDNKIVIDNNFVDNYLFKNENFIHHFMYM